ncbi:hypothetical protein [Baileyella intestinalis]|uniref:hypothetical protein n=1 Tax=Baileyella intestinalis TaxID=2606709 RepID=UPI003A89827A
MEVTVKMNAQEALATVEKGTLASLIKSAESELEKKSAKPENSTPRPETSTSKPAAQAKPEAPVKIMTPQTPAPQQDEPAPDIPQTPAPQAPVSAVSYSADDLQKAAIGLMDMGKQPELIALLRSFGVEALPALPQDKYDAFALKLRELGARI